MEQKHSIRIQVDHAFKSFDTKQGKFTAVKDVSFNVYNHEFLVILGPGRCGKTVLLKMICGLLQKDGGSIRVDGEEVTGPNPKLGMVFQRTGLLPWLTVQENVEFGPKMRGIPASERHKSSAYFLELVGLKGFEKYYPYQLSGGMKQRVGIARAYANGAEILIMDEPFGQLDAQTRINMQNEIIRISQQEKRTIIFVTNNIEEAIKIGDRIILLTQCPAQLKETYAIDFQKPRDEISPEFLKLRKEISDNTDLAL